MRDTSRLIADVITVISRQWWSPQKEDMSLRRLSLSL